MTSVMGCAAATLVAAGLALAQEAPPAQQTPPAPPSGTAPPAGVPAPAGPALRLSLALDLSAEQRTQVQTILGNQDSQLQPLLPQLRENREAIQKLARGGATGEAFETQLQTLAGAQGSLVSQVAVIRAKASAQIWALLTPAQRLKALRMPGLLNPEDPATAIGDGSPRNRLMRPYRPAR